MLNSELLDLWYAVRGKNPRDVWRNYEPKRMNEMPYRPPPDDARGARVANLVRAVAANRRQLLPHRKAFRGLERVVKDPWSTGPVQVDEAGLLAELPAAETVSLRIDPHLEVALEDPGRARVTRAAPDELELRRGRAKVGVVRGDPARLDILEQVLGARTDERVAENALPKDLVRFRELADQRRVLVDNLLAEGRRLVEEVERLVCALYDVPPDLTDEVVAHAVKRAAATSGAD
ncbi:MAG TPA: hypothetical protein VF101_12705 [Gaiellaceae bacterium]